MLTNRERIFLRCNMFKSKILKQLSFLFFIVITISLTMFAVFMLDTFNEHTMINLTEQMTQTTKNIQFALTKNYPDSLSPSESLDEYIKDIAKLNKVNIYLLDNQQSLLSSSTSNSDLLILPDNLDKVWYDSSNVKIYTRKHLEENERYIYAVTKLSVHSANYLLVTTGKMKDLSENLTNIRHITFSGLIFATLLALLISIQAARNFTKPILELTSAAENYSHGQLEHKIFLKSNDEFAALAYALNNLANTLSDKIKESDMEKRKLSLILEQMDNAVMLIDRSGIIQTLNRRAMGIFSTTNLNKNNMHSIEVLGSAYFETNLRKVMSTNTSCTIDLKLRINDISKTFQVFLTPISEAYSNTPKYILCVFYDITTLMSIYDKQVEFVANASHELRTPLTSIRGFAETIEDVADQPELVTKFSKIIQDESFRMQRLISDLLQLAKLDSMEYRNSISIVPTDISKLLPEICVQMEQQAKEKHLNLNYIDNNQENSTIHTNYDWLKQALVNLVENAIKYTHIGGKILLTVHTDKSNCIFTVQDNGPGMLDSDLKRIFDRFYRLDSARNRSTGGTGLGLSIVSFITQLLGATIQVESQVGAGTKFTIIVPSIPVNKTKNN